jgi:hypothetical protein
MVTATLLGSFVGIVLGRRFHVAILMAGLGLLVVVAPLTMITVGYPLSTAICATFLATIALQIGYLVGAILGPSDETSVGGWMAAGPNRQRQLKA